MFRRFHLSENLLGRNRRKHDTRVDRIEVIAAQHLLQFPAAQRGRAKDLGSGKITVDESEKPHLLIKMWDFLSQLSIGGLHTLLVDIIHRQARAASRKPAHLRFDLMPNLGLISVI